MRVEQQVNVDNDGARERERSKKEGRDERTHRVDKHFNEFHAGVEKPPWKYGGSARPNAANNTQGPMINGRRRHRLRMKSYIRGPIVQQRAVPIRSKSHKGIPRVLMYMCTCL